MGACVIRWAANAVVLGFLIGLLCGSGAAFGQKTVETREMRDETMVRKRTEFSSKYERTREAVYGPNGRLKGETFFEDGERVRSIYYDTTGRRIDEWRNPEIEDRKRRRAQAAIFLLVGAVVAGLVRVGCKRNYYGTYHALLFSTVIYIVIAFYSDRRLPETALPPVLASGLGALLLILPGAVFALSWGNLLRKTTIPLAVTVLALVLSALFLLYCTLAMAMAGVGMLG